MNQHIVEDGKKRPLDEFANSAILYLRRHPECDEVVQQADNIVELGHDGKTRPENIYELPVAYEYCFSGFHGQVIGVGRPGINQLHKTEG